ncbi:hypothetical protein SLNWT_3550 [Streptomyces albus]|uniref:Uncharacterized protein n=1 Tax=Streptomyces albus (strain ATCC 21838 / DSM 41398 / FERM P-419 / JCM 4703 / NBRC 107858) TaxID=1081613 RepID=A0A0B5EZ79_STRA4|nr:hypothetical protein SLNWT_3550 [Streptomyces albus]AOU78230.1 hypothetical protein SLNHY_3539 [Streptomyces albus]AYN33983.1 hypothetical protein DUI70_3482 [Streptomyces albus]
MARCRAPGRCSARPTPDAGPTPSCEADRVDLGGFGTTLRGPPS